MALGLAVGGSLGDGALAATAAHADPEDHVTWGNGMTFHITCIFGQKTGDMKINYIITREIEQRRVNIKTMFEFSS